MIKTLDQHINESKDENHINWDEVRQHPMYRRLTELGFEIVLFESFDETSTFDVVFEANLKLDKLKHRGELTPHAPFNTTIQFFLTAEGKIYRKIYNGISVDQMTLDRSVFMANSFGRWWKAYDVTTALIIVYNRLVKLDSDLWHKYKAALDFSADPDLAEEAIDKSISDQINNIW